MWWSGVLKLLALASTLSTGLSRYDCETYEKQPGRCTSVGHCRDLCPGSNLSFLRNSLAMAFDDPACLLSGIMSNAKQVCCPKLKCPQKVPVLNIVNIEDADILENLIRTRRSDSKDPINKDPLNLHKLLVNQSSDSIKHHTSYITHTVYHETRFTFVQTSTTTLFHTYDVPEPTIILSTVEIFTTLPVTHVTRSTITVLPDIPTSTTTITDLIHVYTGLSPTRTLTTTVYGHIIDKTSTFTPVCDVDINADNTSLISTKTHTVDETITSTRTTLRTHVSYYSISLTSYRYTTYTSTVTQIRVIQPTQVLYTTISANVSDLTKTAYTTTENVYATLKIPYTFSLTETIYSSMNSQYHTVTATDCTRAPDPEIINITTEPSSELSTEDITPTSVPTEEATEELSIPETFESTTEKEMSTEMLSETATEDSMTTDIAEDNTTTTDTSTEELTTIENDIEKGTRSKTNVFCAIPSAKEKYAKLKVITCGMDQKNVICMKKDKNKLPENSVVLVICYRSFTQRAKCGHDSKWRPDQINSSNNFTESFTLCNIPDKQ